MATAHQPHHRSFSDAEYLTAIDCAPFGIVARYVCPDCDGKPGLLDGSHALLHGSVVIGCGGYLVVDPNEVGFHMPHWLSLPAQDSTTAFHTTVALQLDRDELASILCDLYCTRGGDEPKPLPQLTAESLREAVAFRAQSCARGWHEPYYEPDNEDVVTLWAHAQIDRLLPDLITD